MVKTIGSTDRKPRKGRRDKGKRRKKYAGKLVRTKKQIRFEKRIGRKTHLKLRWLEKSPMSKDGWMRWNPKVRLKIKPFVYRWGARVDSPVEQLSSKEAIEEWALNTIGYEVEAIIMGCSGTIRNSKRVKWVKLCRLEIIKTPDGLKARFLQNYRLFRYWFWNKS